MKRDIYTKFGECWNEADFSPFSKKLLKDCTYTSFDFFYKLKGRGRLIEYLNEQAKKNKNMGDSDRLDIHRGYYQKTNTMLKSINECCIMVKGSELKTVSIITFSKKFGKISAITGINPEEVKSIRDIKI